MTDVTQILWQIESGDPSAAEQLLPLVYDELRKLAAVKMASEQPGQTLQATALVHDAYLRLVDQAKVQRWNSRGHFFGAAAEAMRRILVEKARHKGRKKHGGGLQQIELPDITAPSHDDMLMALDAALPGLVEEDSTAAEVVKLKYFVGLSREEIAQIMGMTVHEVRQKWAYARAWLRLEMEN